jgi:hypothetical protein
MAGITFLMPHNPTRQMSAGLRVGGSLAISPSTSVTTGFNVAYLTNPHFTDFVVPNSDWGAARIFETPG